MFVPEAKVPPDTPPDTAHDEYRTLFVVKPLDLKWLAINKVPISDGTESNPDELIIKVLFSTALS